MEGEAVAVSVFGGQISAVRRNESSRQHLRFTGVLAGGRSWASSGFFAAGHASGKAAAERRGE